MPDASVPFSATLSHDWLYKPEFREEYVLPGSDESGFELVTLPHANINVPLSGFDDTLYQFISCYRRHLFLPHKWQHCRVLLDFDGAMTCTEVFCNGVMSGQHKGGYTPFTIDLTPHVTWGNDNLIAIKVDSTERPDIPPFGFVVDYLTFGGIYRNVRLRVVNPVYFERVLVTPVDVMSDKARVDISCHLINTTSQTHDFSIALSLRSAEGAILRKVEQKGSVQPGDNTVSMQVADAATLPRWDLDRPALIHVQTELTCGNCSDAYTTRFGMRECRFTSEGFLLNGRKVHLRGLNRHQTFPWVGAAMPARVQRKDAEILRNELKVNMVRTSHYPQSPDFLDACDELGLLVMEEIPGWQHIGDDEWKTLSVENVRRMVLRDYNHPSIVLWLTRINESLDSDEFYTRTNAMAKQLDPTRATGGVRYLLESNLIEDVFTMNDFDPVQLKTPNHPCYMVTEFCGHMYSTKHFDNVERVTEHVRRHAHIQSQAAAMPGMSGAIGWCAFDYNTHRQFGSGDRICHHGVMDMFRIPKKAAYLYKSQCSPEEEVVLEPGFNWSAGDKSEAGGVGKAYILSNCDRLIIYRGDMLLGQLFPERGQFPGLVHPPFVFEDANAYPHFQDYRIEGYIGDRHVATKRISVSGVDEDLVVRADDSSILADGVDMTRIVFMVTDKYGNHRNLAVGALNLSLEGPGRIIGDNPIALIGGCGAVWVQSTGQVGQVALTVSHPYLGSRSITIRMNAVEQLRP